MKGESQNFSRLSKKNVPVIITFQTPVPQPAVRVRSERGFHYIETTPTTNYHLQPSTPQSKSRLEKAKNINDIAFNQKSIESDKKTNDDVLIFKSNRNDMIVEYIGDQNDKSEESSESLVAINSQGSYNIKGIL